MHLSDKFLVAFIIGWLLLDGAFWLTRLWGWAILWLGIFGMVGMMEAISKIYTNHTITQLFGLYVKSNHLAGGGMLLGMLIVWLLLLIHLAL